MRLQVVQQAVVNPVTGSVLVTYDPRLPPRSALGAVYNCVTGYRMLKTAGGSNDQERNETRSPDRRVPPESFFMSLPCSVTVGKQEA